MHSDATEDKVRPGDRTIVSIFQHTSLSIGAGEEKAILNYIKNVPSETVALTVYQTDFCPNRNISDEEISAYASKIKLVTLKSILSKFNFNVSGESGKNIATRYIGKAFYLFLKVLVDPIVNRIVNRNLLNGFTDSDVAFIYDAEYVGLIPKAGKDIPIVGTFRRDFGPGFRKSTLRNIVIYIAYSCVVRRVKVFHFLTQRLYSNSPIHHLGDFVLSSGTDLEEYYPDPTKRNGPIKFLFVARLERVKGVMDAIESFNRLGEVDAELHIAGSGPLANYVKDKAASNNRIFYEGYLGKNELASLYRKCDVLFFPTRLSEQHPLIVVEAVASGLKIITTENLRGIFDFFEKEEVLEYVNSDVDILASKLKEYANLKDTLRKNASVYAKKAENYDWRIISAKLFSHLVEVSRSCRN